MPGLLLSLSRPIGDEQTNHAVPLVEEKDLIVGAEAKAEIAVPGAKLDLTVAPAKRAGKKGA